MADDLPADSSSIFVPGETLANRWLLYRSAYKQDTYKKGEHGSATDRYRPKGLQSNKQPQASYSPPAVPVRAPWAGRPDRPERPAYPATETAPASQETTVH